jgi:hypothetical protein
MRPLAALALAVTLAALVAGCGGGGGGDAQARAAVKRNWETFFDGSTAAAVRTRLLQNGAQFASIIRAISASPLSRQLAAKVSNVDVTAADSAKVTYTLYLGRNAVLKNAQGDAVRVNGSWKVGVASFCQLLALQGATPKPCAAASK